MNAITLNAAALAATMNFLGVRETAEKLYVLINDSMISAFAEGYQTGVTVTATEAVEREDKIAVGAHEEGFDSGYEAGYSDGLNIGAADAQDGAQEARDDAYADGYAQGRTDEARAQGEVPLLDSDVDDYGYEVRYYETGNN